MFRVDAQNGEARQHRPAEITLRAAEPRYAAEPRAFVRVIFRHESGVEHRGLGFHDGGDVWRVRFAPPQPGLWRWRSLSGDGGLDGRSGVLRVAHADGDTPLARHGPPALQPGRRTLQHADGRPFFWLGDTCWEVPAGATPQEWEIYLDRRAAQGFSVVQMNTLPQWDAALPHRREPFARGADGAIDAGQIDHGYFQTLDALVDRAAERGIASALIVLWFNYVPGHRPAFYVARPEGFAPELKPEHASRLARYVGARYAAYPVIWLLTGDTGFTSPGDEPIFQAVAAEIAEASFEQRPVSAHINGDQAYRPRVVRQPWHTFHMYQSCHFAHGSGFPAAYARAARALRPVRPVVNGEQCYEELGFIHGEGRVPREWVRHAAWEAMLAGANGGITYGAHGIWPWYREGTTFPGADSWLAPPLWHEALHLPGADDMARLKRILSELPWWDLDEAPELPVAEADAAPATVARVGGTRILAYLRAARPLRLTDPALAGAAARWLDPADDREEPATLEPYFGGVRALPPSWAHDALLLVG